MRGQSADEPVELPDPELPGFFDEVPDTRKHVRALIGGAAALAVLAGGAGAFLWLGSVPAADASVLGSGTVATTPAETADPSSPSAVAFAGSGRDIFDQLTTPAAEGSATSTSTGTGGAATAGGSGAAGPSASSGGGTVPSSRATTAPGATAAPQVTATATKAPATTKPPAPTSAAPTVSRSTAPAWQKGVVTFDSIPVGSTTGTADVTLDADGTNPVKDSLRAGSLLPSTSTVYRPWGTTTERAMTDDEKAACELRVKDAATSEDAARINRQTKNCTVTDDYVWQAVFVPSSQSELAVTNAESFGWLVAAGTKLPDAVVGKVTGTVRWIGGRGDRYLLQVNGDPGTWVKAGDTIPGTPLVFEGIGLKSIARDDVAVFSANGTQYFTVLGGGENAGVTF